MRAAIIGLVFAINACGDDSGSGAASTDTKTSTTTLTDVATATATAATTTTATATATTTATATETATTVSLAGTWKSDCIEPAPAVFATIMLTNTATESTLDAVYYLTDDCLSPVRKDTSKRTYAIVGAVDGVTGGVKVDMTYSSLSTTLYTDELVAEANGTTPLWSLTGWVKGEAKDTTGAVAVDGEKNTAAGEVSYLIVKIDGTSYTSGDVTTGDGTTPEKRATAFGNVKLTKQ